MNTAPIDKKCDIELATMHLFYLGGLLIEGMKNFHTELVINCRSDIVRSATYLRMSELRDKFESAALINAR